MTPASRTPDPPGARVDVNDEKDRQHWCKEFECTETRLKSAVKIVGPLVADVRRYFKK